MSNKNRRMRQAQIFSYLFVHIPTDLINMYGCSAMGGDRYIDTIRNIC